MKEKLLLLHGALGSKKQFAGVIPILEKRFDVHAIDFAGHGGSVSEADFSMQSFAQNAIGFINENQFSEVNIFGYSMGGYVALNIALKSPERIKKVVTLGTKFNWNLESALKETQMLDPDMIEEKVPHFAHKLKEEHFPQDWKKVLQQTGNMMLGLAKSEKLTEKDFKKITTQTTIGIGSLDKMVTVEESAKVAETLPNGTLQIIEGFPHPIEKIAPEALAGYILGSF